MVQARPRNGMRGEKASRLRLAAPWYVHPAEAPAAWNSLLTGSDLSFAVVNAANGPSPWDPYYREVLGGQSMTPLAGYVTVDYGRRPSVLVLKDVQDWLSLPAVSGVMFDCVPPVESGEWRLSLIEEARWAGAQLVAANPGRPPSLDLVAAADVTCVGEYGWATFRKWKKPDYLDACPSDRQWILVHGVPEQDQGEALEKIRSEGAGLGWATSGELPNPWAVLPLAW